MYHISIFLAILALSFFLFSTEVLSLEISALVVLCLVILSNSADKLTCFQNFGNDSLIMIASLLVMVGGLQKTGVIRKFENLLVKYAGSNKSLTFFFLISSVALLSIFVSNTATLAVTIPIIVSISKRFNESPKTWLMPIAFASVLGGMNSLIGTSTNIIISGIIPNYGFDSFKLFTTTSIAWPILLIGILYLLFFRKLLLKDNTKEALKPIELRYDLRSYTTEVTISENSKLCNSPLEDSGLAKEGNLVVIGVVRASIPFIYPHGALMLRANDRLIVEGNLEKLTEIQEKYGLVFSDERNSQNKEKKYALDLHEVLLTSNSRFVNKTPAQAELRSRHKLSLIAVNRQGVTIRDKLSELKMTPGDILVVQFIKDIDNTFLERLGLIPLQHLKKERFRAEKATHAVLIFIGALLLGSITNTSLALSCLIGAILMIIFQVLRSHEIYTIIDWKILIFIGAVLSLGSGMVGSGAADKLGAIIYNIFSDSPTIYIRGFFFILTAIMTSLLSNQATAVVMIPLAISSANLLNLPPMSLIMTVTIAASCCFITPFEPAFMLVYGPGGYKFKDFFKLGFPLVILGLIVTLFFVPLFW